MCAFFRIFGSVSDCIFFGDRTNFFSSNHGKKMKGGWAKCGMWPLQAPPRCLRIGGAYTKGGGGHLWGWSVALLVGVGPVPEFTMFAHQTHFCSSCLLFLPFKSTFSLLLLVLHGLCTAGAPAGTGGSGAVVAGSGFPANEKGKKMNETGGNSNCAVPFHRPR